MIYSCFSFYNLFFSYERWLGCFDDKVFIDDRKYWWGRFRCCLIGEYAFHERYKTIDYTRGHSLLLDHFEDEARRFSCPSSVCLIYLPFPSALYHFLFRNITDFVFINMAVFEMVSSCTFYNFISRLFMLNKIKRHNISCPCYVSFALSVMAFLLSSRLPGIFSSLPHASSL